MKIGIGVTTYNRPKHRANWSDIWHKFIGTDKAYHIASDDINGLGYDYSNERKGIAYRKNECLRALQDCDYVFLFDDDCFPIKKGWSEFFIEAHKASGQHHFLYIKETPTIKQTHIHLKPEDPLIPSLPYSINEYNNCGGCFMFLTKEVIEKVGAFDETFGLYGFEHADYSDRIHMAGLTPMGKYLCPAGASEYIYAMDYDYHLPFNKQVDHKPSLPVTEVVKLLQSSQQTYYNKQKTIFLPL